jgi:glycosyltransferase involved in cell wall biosynthesis
MEMSLLLSWKVGFVGKTSLRILQVSTSDIGGGAEKIAWDMLQIHRASAVESWLAVGSKFGTDPYVIQIPLSPSSPPFNLWAFPWFATGDVVSPWVGRVRGMERLRNLLRMTAQPSAFLQIQQGHEDFFFPGTSRLLDLTPEKPDILHCHNLHGGFFDLRVLPWISQRVPTILTLHDAWLLSGHCAHSFDCERWKTGCGLCPDLTIPPAIKHDATAYNWKQKKDIYAGSRLYIATPSQWLMRKVEQSILASAIVEARVIPNGVDIETFHPGDKQSARNELGIPQSARVLLFVGSTTRSNPWKDFKTLEAAVRQVAECLPNEKVILICLGEEKQPEHIGKAEVQFLGFKNHPEDVARFYQAADLYLHATKADTFPNTVLEALACGTPVVATAVGGIPEQIRDGETGFLVPVADTDSMAKQTLTLLINDAMRHQFGLEASHDARERFNLAHQAGAYLEWYSAISDDRDKKM